MRKARCLRQASRVRNVRFHPLVITDVDTIRSRKGYRIPSVTARKLQRQIKSDQISLGQFYDGIRAAMVPFRIQ
jgi:hypothetical protein